MKRLSLVFLGVLLTGCAGTYITGRDVDRSADYPKLHTVPDRPAKKDFSDVKQRLDDFETSHEEAKSENQRLRGVTRPAFVEE